MEIAPITLQDLDDVTQMGRAFFFEAGWDKYYTWHDFEAFKALSDLITQNKAIMFMAKDPEPVGMIAGMVYPIWYNPTILTGQELFLYVKPEKRNGIGHKLKSLLEKEFKEKGAITSVLGSVEGMPSLDDYYARSGYDLSEKTFIKRL